jgi:hypothetical protein
LESRIHPSLNDIVGLLRQERGMAQGLTFASVKKGSKRFEYLVTFTVSGAMTGELTVPVDFDRLGSRGRYRETSPAFGRIVELAEKRLMGTLASLSKPK